MKPHHKNYQVVSLTQKWIIMVGVISHVIFVPSIHYYLTENLWGASFLSWKIPNQLVVVLGYPIHTYTLISGHVITSYLLLLSMLFQFLLMLSCERSTKVILLHRIIGSIASFIFLPFFSFFALSCSFFITVTPFNRILFALLPIMIIYGMIKGIIEIFKGSKINHIDAMYLALICLNAAPFFRLIAAISFFLGYPVISTFGNHEPDNFLPLFRTIFLIIALSISYLSVGRLKKNIYPILIITLVLILSLQFVPWQFYGDPS